MRHGLTESLKMKFCVVRRKTTAPQVTVSPPFRFDLVSPPAWSPYTCRMLIEAVVCRAIKHLTLVSGHQPQQCSPVASTERLARKRRPTSDRISPGTLHTCPRPDNVSVHEPRVAKRARPESAEFLWKYISGAHMYRLCTENMPIVLQAVKLSSCGVVAAARDQEL